MNGIVPLDEARRPDDSEQQKKQDMSDCTEKSPDETFGEVMPLTKVTPFGVVSLLGMGYSISNTAMTCIGSLAASLGGGGPIVFIWGLPLVFTMSFCVAVSLGELASAMPHAGGQYYWASRLAPPGVKRGLSYMVGILSWSGAIVTGASATLAIPQFILGMVVLTNPDFVIRPWMVFAGYQITNILVFCLNLFERLLPTFNLISMYASVLSMILIFITLLSVKKTKSTSSSVFADINNFTGWPDGVAFISSLVGPNWGFACLDAVTHMAEEIPDPARNIPKALMATVFIGIATGWPFMVGIMFCLDDIDSVVGTATGVPSLQLFYDSLNSEVGACALQSLILVVFVGALYGIHTWQSRMAWSFARDNAWPFSAQISKMSPPPFNTPLIAHTWSCAWTALLGCIYLGSSLAFNSLVSGGIILQYLSYSTCVILLLLHGRSKITPGPFWYPKLGIIANYVLLLWTLITLAFYSLPATNPTTATTMNYVACVIVFMFLYAGAYWAITGKRHYKCP